MSSAHQVIAHPALWSPAATPSVMAARIEAALAAAGLLVDNDTARRPTEAECDRYYQRTATDVRSGCCGDRRKPCPYHDGYCDGLEAGLDYIAGADTGRLDTESPETALRAPVTAEHPPSGTSGPPNAHTATEGLKRILWNRRPTGPLDFGDIDEIVIQHPASVHIRQLNVSCWWIGIDTCDGMWHGNFYASGRGRMTFGQQENEGFEWDRDETHELGT